MRSLRLDASACSHWPIWHDPVNDTALSGLESMSACPNSPPDPATKLTTPLGTPASCSASTIRQALSGAAEARFRTPVFPQISAGASFHTGLSEETFQRVTLPPTPLAMTLSTPC